MILDETVNNSNVSLTDGYPPDACLPDGRLLLALMPLSNDYNYERQDEGFSGDCLPFLLFGDDDEDEDDDMGDDFDDEEDFDDDEEDFDDDEEDFDDDEEDFDDDDEEDFDYGEDVDYDDDFDE